MIVRKLGDKKPKVLIFQGSPRDKDTCSGMISKTHKIVEYMTSKWSPFVNFQVIDLAVNHSKQPSIQPCKGCVSTAGGYHCHFDCSCYFKGDKNPDLLKELDVYKLLQECDAFIIVSPIHWHSLTSQVKLLFDRLVCINQTLTIEDARKLMGDYDDIKNPDITGKFARSGKYDEMLRNHLEGKVAGFYVHGDDGADDYEGKELPESYDVMDDGFSNNPKNVVMPFIMQLKYSGIYVPDELVEAFYTNKGVNYNTANKTFNKNKEFFDRANNLIENLLNYLDNKSNI